MPAPAQTNGYNGQAKKLHLPKKREPLEIECLRDGSLDVCLLTGEVYGIKGGQRTRLKTRLDKDEYVTFVLSREKPHRRGKPAERDHRRNRNRWRIKRTVLVHRLVKVKAIAVALGGGNWRQYVKPLPPGIDVNHIPDPKTGVPNRSDNRASVLELQTDSANRAKREMTDEEWDRVRREFV